MVTRNVSSLIFPGTEMISLSLPGFSVFTLFEDGSDMFFFPVLTQDSVSVPLVDHLTMLTYLITPLYLRCQQLVQLCRLQDGPFLSLEEMTFKNQPTLLASFSLQDHIPWDSSKQTAEKAKISKEVHSCDTTFFLIISCLYPDSTSPWSLQSRLLSAYTF